MLNRRQFVFSAAAAVGGVSLLQAYSFAQSNNEYEKVVNETWRKQMLVGAIGINLRRELVRYATLAPSSHNTQCWKFKIEDNAITILPDFLRRCPAVDPDDHHLFISMGCASENLVQAARAHGFRSEATTNSNAEGEIRISLEPGPTIASPLFNAITERQCTRSEYDGKPLSAGELAILEKAGTGKGVQLLMFTDKAMMESILEHVVQANGTQMADPAFIKELKTWIRFNKGEAIRKGDGLLSVAAGNPALPRWLGDLIFGLVFKPDSENKKYVKQVRSSSGIAVFTSDASSKGNWMEVGRCYERFALQSTSLGIRNAFLNQPVEVPNSRKQFATFLGIGNRRPDLIVRFGRGSLMPRSVRRPIEAVIV